MINGPDDIDEIKWFKKKLIMTKKDRNAKTLNELIKNKIIKI